MIHYFFLKKKKTTNIYTSHQMQNLAETPPFSGNFLLSFLYYFSLLKNMHIDFYCNIRRADQ